MACWLMGFHGAGDGIATRPAEEDDVYISEDREIVDHLHVCDDRAHPSTCRVPHVCEGEGRLSIAAAHLDRGVRGAIDDGEGGGKDASNWA
eukprot:CAMPEP_0174719892 /NCGR_PEP_ID=MMETSP1094-20130205/32236_1 /TAXON_ID=156173 /ORGANISM="Chrysochromulina brevifilum, Strain UTEX LB 985" /LENGTH=90 /DNA_ID=CAMNT_0015920285 /DNA_START=463 /DNA_END=735 /DNA_ORIENTATION=+